MSDNFPLDNFLKIDDITNNDKFSFAINLDKKDDICEKEETSSEKSSDLDSIQLELLKHLQQLIGPQIFNTYFKNTFSLVAMESEDIIFSVTTPFIKTMVEAHYIPQIKESINNLFGFNYNVIIEIKSNKRSLSSDSGNILKSLGNLDDNLPPKDNKQSKEVSFSLDLTPTLNDLKSEADSNYIKHMNGSELSKVIIDTNKKFSNFIVGPSNNIAYASAYAVAERPGNLGKYPSLYLYSSSGLGKTHLLHSVGNTIREKYPEHKICLITARELMNEYVNAMQTGTSREFRKKYSQNIDVLMIDDIHELKNKKGTQDEFFHIFNELHGRGKQLIFTSDQHPSEIDGIPERIKTRLQWGLCVDIQKPDYETRIAILKGKAKELDLFLSDEIINLIASSIKSDIRALEGSLVHLHAYSSFMSLELDTEVVRQSLKLNVNADSEEVTLERIIKAISKYYKVPIADIKSKGRKKELVNVRHLAMYLSQKMAKATLVDIGRFYGRDHSSVIHAIKKVEEQLKTDQLLSKDIVTIETNF